VRGSPHDEVTPCQSRSANEQVINRNLTLRLRRYHQSMDTQKQRVIQHTFENPWWRLLAQALAVGTSLFCLVVCVAAARDLTQMSAEFAEDMCVTALSISFFFLPLFAWAACGIHLFLMAWQRGCIPTKTLLLIAVIPVSLPILNESVGVSCEPGYVPSGPMIEVLGMFVAVPIAVALLLAAISFVQSDVNQS
jgi:hypothetical protein